MNFIRPHVEDRARDLVSFRCFTVTNLYKLNVLKRVDVVDGTWSKT